MTEATETRRIGDPDPRVKRLNRKRLLITIVVLLMVAAPGAFYFSGSYDRWQDGRSLADTCRGSVDTSEIKELLGGDRLRGHDIEEGEGVSPRAGRLHKCSVGIPDGGSWVSVALDWNPDAAGPLHDFGGFTPYGDVGMAIPFGHGWQGVMDQIPMTNDLVAMVNVPCANRGSDARHSSLIVTVQGNAMRSMEEAVQRARFARTSVKTAQNAAKAWGCEAQTGSAIDRVPVNTAHAEVKPGAAKGTCTGISTTVRESATDPKAPIENCYLLPDSGSSHYRLSAFYGPFVQALPAQAGYGDEFDPEQPSGHKGSAFWASAECSSGGPALYIATSVPDGDRILSPDGRLAKTALREFATRSAKRHGCTGLKLP
ncbi:hypothetical protein Sgleb_59750 [Streptomyces glebosus]|uniref:Uncharacterized protein n=1 Tax=Streptomyces glebosus TaxID=249580 RepID=A0A640T3P3_9ACTN|nr:hypothetical protein [Streptomyces glebosus]GFE17928.1 hypothetical protein Sgleb_59750 [Streptomyces glebosus]GHG47048.1 hypothetical protein GCM10010513_03240 [Streptomyces glebosus]